MAKQMECATTNSKNYSEPDDEDVVLHAGQMISGALKLEDYRPIQELERIKSDRDQILTTAQFSSPQEKAMAENLQRNTNGWIDTAKDALCLAIDFSGLVNVCRPAINSGVLTSDDVAIASHHVIAIGETLKRIYSRSCDMAVDNSTEFLLAIDNDENISQNAAVKIAAVQHRNDLKNFQEGKVNINVPHQSHAKLAETVKQVEPNKKSNVINKAERSSRAWDIALSIGSIVLAVGVIVGIAISKR